MSYPDIDALDEQALHLLGFDSEQRLIAYLRILPPEAHYKEPAIGGLLSHDQRVGRALVVS